MWITEITCHGLVYRFLYVKFLPPCCSGSARSVCWLLCSPMSIACSTVDVYPFPFYCFLGHLPVCFTIYRHAQFSQGCLSNFQVLWAPVCLVFCIFSVWLPVYLPWLHLPFVLSNRPDLSSFPGSFSLSCDDFYSSYLSGLCLISQAYLGASTWFQIAASPYPPSGALVKKGLILCALRAH